MIYLDLILIITSFYVAIREQPDIVHAHLHEGLAIGWLIKLFLRKPLIADLQGKLSEEMASHNYINKETLFFKAVKFLENFLETIPDQVVVSNRKTKELLSEGSPSPSITLLSDGITIEGSSNSEIENQVEYFKREYDIPSEQLTFVYLGLLNKYQGIDLLLNAIDCMNSNIRSKSHFVIMGYPNVSKYTERTKELEISKHLTFTGRVDYEKAGNYLAVGDFAITPKIDTSEGNGKIFNYMAAGLPVIAFETTVNKDILGGLGIYVKNQTKESLSKKIEKVTMNPSSFRNRGKKGKEVVKEQYSWDSNIQDLEKIYQDNL